MEGVHEVIGMWVYLGLGVYLGIAVAVLGMLSFTWLRDLRSARAVGLPSRRLLVLYPFLFVVAVCWPLGLMSIWVRGMHHASHAPRVEHIAR